LDVEHVEDDVMRTETPSGHTVTMDSSATPGGEGATPVEMLLASAAACSLMDVVMILDKKRVEYENLTAHVEGTRREEDPTAFTDVSITYTVEGDVPDKALEDACRLSVDKYCTVLATLREDPDVEWDYEVR
jgi:putative redox protein